MPDCHFDFRLRDTEVTDSFRGIRHREAAHRVVLHRESSRVVEPSVWQSQPSVSGLFGLPVTARCRFSSYTRNGCGEKMIDLDVASGVSPRGTLTGRKLAIPPRSVDSGVRL